MPTPLARLTRLAAVLTIGLSALSACAGEADAGPALAADEPLPTKVPEGTTLTVGDPVTEQALKLSGEADEFSFDVKWANISGGPQTTEAFRADSLDIGAVAEIPAIHATWTGLPVKIVASKFRVDPLDHPVYELGIAPGAKIKKLTDLKGKKIAYSPGQAQGALVLRILKQAKLTKADVELVELPSSGDEYPNALSSDEVDAAPIGGVTLKRYLAKYKPDGASSIKHGLRDDPSHLYVRTETLADGGKAAAIREYVRAWARASVWVYQHPKEWIKGYYITDQGLSETDAEYLVDNVGEPDIPSSWKDAIERHQDTIDLLAKATGNEKLDAADLYDRRYERVGAEAAKGEKE